MYNIDGFINDLIDIHGSGCIVSRRAIKYLQSRVLDECKHFRSKSREYLPLFQCAFACYKGFSLVFDKQIYLEDPIVPGFLEQIEEYAVYFLPVEVPSVTRSRRYQSRVSHWYRLMSCKYLIRPPQYLRLQNSAEFAAATLSICQRMEFSMYFPSICTYCW